MIKIGPKGTIKTQAPRNYNRAEQVQIQLNHTLAKANRQYLEAIAVDGFDINYWRKSSEGKFCTCHAGKPDHVYKLNDSSDNPTIAPTEVEQDTQFIFKVRGSKPVTEEQKNKTTEAFGIKVGELPLDDDGQQSKLKTFDDSWEELEKLADDEAFSKMGVDSAILFGGERTQCGICFGTGHIYGYLLVNGMREVFDATQTHPTETNGFVLDSNTKPHSFSGPRDTNLYVEYQYELPTYFEKCISINLRNNTKKAVGLKAEYKILNSADNFQLLTPEFINSRIGTSTKIIIRISPTRNDLTGLVRFTHLELNFQFSPWPKAQMPGLSESTNFGVFDSLLTTEFTLPPTINKVDKEDVIYDSKHNHIWKITDYTDFMTSQRQVMGWSANARVIQQFEQLALLKLVIESTFELSFSHLETFQGMFTKGDDKV